MNQRERTLCCRLILAAAQAYLFLAIDSLVAEEMHVKKWLERGIIGPKLVQQEVQQYCEARIPPMPSVESREQWEVLAARIRADMLDKVVFRGEASGWRDAETRVEWLETLKDGAGYKIKKLRYEALPGLWIPALLYEPDKLPAKAAVVMNVNGHDGEGKSANYKQIRCINQAKRGMLALNVEWLGMGQLRGDGYSHYRMNQLDLCGTSGLAPFYLSMKRGLDVLLSHEHADPQRVAVVGLSGGGWQTIFISSLDTRVTLANPVAGYSSFITRIHHHKDLGDSEQTPCDMATVADYTHLTALLAPRPALLTYNLRDNCCFESGYALPPLLDAARPIYKLFRKELDLRHHVSHYPGNHNFYRDNREALYRMLRDYFSDPQSPLSGVELPSDATVKSAEELKVELPENNATFQSLALNLIKNLPQDADLPTSELPDWQHRKRAQLQRIIRWKSYDVRAREVTTERDGEDVVKFWQLRIGESWTVPAVEIMRGETKTSAIVVAEAGRSTVTDQVEQLLDDGHRVVVVDPFYFGESKIAGVDFLFALLVSAVGDRPLGLQASQVGAIARWLKQDRKSGPVSVNAIGPRASLIVMCAAAIDVDAIAKVELHRSYGSLKEVIETNSSADRTPEMFCFGLLKQCDLKQIAALIVPREVVIHNAGDRAKAEFEPLSALYGMSGRKFNPTR